MSLRLVKKTEQLAEELALPGPEPALEKTIEWNDSLFAHARELLRHRELLWLITQREIKVRYKQSMFGALWAVLQPFSLMVVFTVFFSWFARMQSDGIPYPLFSYAALLPWTFFSTSLTFAIPSLINNSHIITKIYFPREIVPLASILAAFLDFVIASGIFVLMLVFYRVTLTWNILYVLPLATIQIAYTVGICLLLSAFTVLYRDVRHMLPLLIQIWMFVTPILYPVSVVPARWRVWYLALNPMAVIIDGYRRAVVQGLPPQLPYLALAALVSGLVVWMGYIYFKHLERDFADII
ncbi:MAG: ABC transporter permease [Acidobacteria bacterium]|nr:ABC transporter permease [Acidobacteriota bacterium]